MHISKFTYLSAAVLVTGTVRAMNMPDTSGNSPNANLSLSDPNCIDESCQAFLDAENESQATVTWAGQFLYGHYTTWYYIAILGLLTILHIGRTILDKRAQPESRINSSLSLYQRTVALRRSLSYRAASACSLAWLGLPSLGVGAFILMTIAFLAALVFAVKPYYREHLGYGSPPMAIRTGLMAFACTPILVALAGKANIVTVLTGISHEKLNVLHRWVAWMSFVLSLFHSIPYFLQSYWEGSFYHVTGAEEVKIQFYYWGTTIGGSEYSGVPPLAILFGLCVLSLPWIRDRFYETFYFSHILLGITYVGLLFWHAENILDSWVYLWATLALWLCSWLARTFWYTRPMNIKSSWFTGCPAIFKVLPGGMTRVQLLAPQDFHHKPSQHCFLRFPAMSLSDNHPFTILSAPSPPSSRTGHVPSLTFLIRTHSGFTRTLSDFCTSAPDKVADAWIDGPYGSISRPIERLYDTILLVAGGSGISACISWLSFLASKKQSGDYLCVTRVILLWTMKEAQHFAWAEEELLAVAEMKSPGLDIDLRFHITADAEKQAPTKDECELTSKPEVASAVENGSNHTTAMEMLGKVSFQRPVMREVVQTSVGGGKTMIFGCGPQSLRNDLSNASAAVQSKVLRGEAREVAMHLESFGW